MQWNLEQDQKDIKDKISQHACLWWKTIYSIAEIEKKYPQVYLEEWKYKNKKNKDAWIYRRCIGIRISSGSK